MHTSHFPYSLFNIVYFYILGKMEESHLAFFWTVQALAGLKKWKNTTIKYKLYKIFIIGVYFYNLFMLQLQLIMARTIEEIMENLSFTTMYTVMTIGIYFLSKPKFTQLFQDIKDFEEILIMKQGIEKNVIEIAHKYSNINNKTNRVIYFTTSIFCVFFIYDYSRLPLRPKNRIKFIFPEYYFFDEEKYYWFVFIDNCIFLVGCLLPLFVYMRFSSITLITYIIARIKMLQHFIRSVETYAKYLSRTQKQSLQEARYNILRSCLIQHIYIIE